MPEGSSAKFDITLSVAGSELFMEYDASLYNEDMISRFLKAMKQCLINAAADGAEALSGLELISPEEKQLLAEWNDADEPYDREATIVSLFEKSADSVPDKLAVAGGGIEYTYRELETRANAVANALLARNINIGDIVALKLSRTADFVCAALGVLKAGAAYLPMDKAYPKDRIDYILGDCNAALMIEDEDIKALMEFSDSSRPNLPLRQKDLCYVIYTSGSTGKPKGILTEHGGVINYCMPYKHNPPIVKDWEEGTACMAIASFTFDMSTAEIYPFLFAGKTTVIASEKECNDPLALAALVRKYHLDCTVTTPSRLMQYFKEPEFEKAMKGFVSVSVGGEAVPYSFVEKIRTLTKADLYNVYGPTEITMCCSSLEIKGDYSNIGRPFANYKLHVLDEFGNQLPPGVPGELCVSGRAVTRGYLNRPELTAEKFVDLSIAEGKVYRTGDLSCWNARGEMEFLGRIDDQVKLRGQRMELGEIEQVMSLYPGIDMAAAAIQKHGSDQYLIGFYSGAGDIDTEDLRRFMLKSLTHYMIPDHFVQLKEMPLSINGKIDRKRLPEAKITAERKSTFVEPQTQLEALFCSIFKQVLGLDSVGVNDNFFEIGGNSLNSIDLTARANREGIRLTAADISEHPTPGSLAAFAESKTKDETKLIAEQGELSGNVPLGPIQKWFFESGFEQEDYFNQSVLLEMDDPDIRMLNRAFAFLIEKHDALRLSVKDGEAVFMKASECGIDIASRRSGQKSIQEIMQEEQRKLSLAQGRLIGVCLIDKKYLFITIHHMAVDVVSWGILLSDLDEILCGLKQGRNIDELAISRREKTSSVRDFAKAITAYAEALPNDTVRSWNKILRVPGALPLAAGEWKPCRMYEAKHYAVRLSPKSTKLLLEEGPKQTGLKEDELVLGAIVRTLRRINDSKTFRLHLENHGREQFDPGISVDGTVGWFTALYPVAVPYGDTGLLSSAYDAAKAIRTAPDQGRSYGALKYCTGRLDAVDAPSLTFNYAGGTRQKKTVSFKVSDIRPENTISPFNHVTDAVSVNAAVNGGSLALDIDIDPEAFEVKNIAQTFVNELKEALNDLAGFFGQDVKYYPLLAAQTGIYLAYLSNPEALNYNEAVELSVRGNVDAGRLCEAIEKAVKAHHSMMTNFTEVEGRIVQYINPENTCEVQRITLAPEKYDAFRKGFVRAFNLANGPLYRITVAEMPGDVRVLIDFHHIIYDRTSSAVFMEDIRRAYEGEPVGTEQFSCADAAVEEERLRDTARYEEDKRFFMSQFEEGYDKAMISKDRDDVEESVSDKIIVEVPSGIHDMVQNRARELGITDNSLYYAAFNYALGIWAGQENVVSGFVSTGRDSEKYAASVGMFVKTLPSMISIEGKLQIGAFLKGVHKKIMETMSHEMYAYSDLVAALDGTELLSVLFAYQNTKTVELSWKDMSIGVEVLDTPDVKFDLTFMAVPGPDKVELDVEYDASAYDKDTIENFIRTFTHILAQLSEKPLDGLLKDLSVTDEFQAAQLEKYNSYTQKYRKDVSVSQLIREQAEKLGDKEAYVFKDVHLSFAEFNRIADRGAGYLVRQGVAQDKVVAILLKRSEKFTLAMLSTVRAGGAYLPLAVDYPADRLSFIMEDTGTSFALISKDFRTDIEWPEGVKLLYAEDMFDESLPADPVEVKCDPDAPFCLLHTSGSTGTPKCAMLSRINQSHFMQIHHEHVKDLDWGIALTTVTFDAFAMDNFMLLCNGIRVYLPTEEETLDQHLMDKVFTEHPNSFLFITPTRLTEMFENTTLEHMLENIGLLFFGGEAIRNDFVERIRRNAPHTRIMQVYGPTETTIVVTGGDQLPGKIHSMGYPFANSKIYILDKEGRQVPFGAVGEIFIGGDNVGLGYRNRPDLTAERFLPDPFMKGKRTMYKTGDLSKRFQDGRIFFVGRADTQIKFHGQRMEIAEVESCIKSFGSITASAVVVRKHGRESYLCAFYTSTEEVNEEELRAYVSGKLVYYMVPSTFTRLEELPHTAGGKMNYRALPEVEFVMQVNPCETKMQEELAQMAAGLLNAESIGRDTNLLSLGMTSLSAIRMNTLIFDKYGVHIKTKDILANPTVEEIESLLVSQGDIAAEETKEPVENGSKDGTYPLTSSQMGVLLDCEKDPDGILYNIPMLYRFPAGIDAVKLRDALYAALDAHPYMNTGFVDSPEGVRQIPHERTGKIEILRLSGKKMEEYVAGFVKPFDLYAPPLWRMTLIVCKGVLYLCLDIHHIIFDGESLAIFMSDVMKAYMGETLEPETHDSFELALREERQEGSASYEESKEYIAGMLSVIDAPSEIPGYHEYGKDPEPAETLRIEIPPEVDEAVKKLAAKWNVTRNHVYTAAFCLMVGKYTYSEAIGIAVLSSARDDADFAGNIGMMVKTLPFVLGLEADEPVEDLVRRVGRQSIELMGHDAYSYAQMVSEFKMQFEIMFSYQNHDEGELTFNGSRVRVSSLVESSAKFPLLFDLAGCFLKIDYDAAKYAKDYVRDMGTNFIELVNFITRNESCLVKEVRMLRIAHKELLDSFNETYDMFDSTRTLVSLFDEQCAKTPDKQALCSGNEKYTYEQVRRISNRIAHMLIRKGVKPGDIVAIRMARSDRLILAIWGLLKAGAAMQPIDMDYPKDRVDYVLDDSEARFVFVEESIGRKNEIIWDSKWITDTGKGKDTSDPVTGLTPEDTAYVIYTSGSTGMPKGVMISHKSIVNYLLPLSHNPFTCAVTKLVERTLSTTTVAFDVFCSEIFASMPLGIEFYMATDEEVENAALLAGMINKNDLQCMHVTPSKLLQYMEDKSFCESMSHLKVMMVAGEPFPVDLAGRIRKWSDVEIYNGYGPTEATIITGFARITDEHVTIGKPLPNSQVHITDRYLNELPVMVVGELCATGVNVGKGYIKRPELNAKVYVDNPFGEGKLYRTGDLARWDSDGNIECLGRIDTQVKLNGLRIEPGEIEAAIRDFPNVTASAVIVADQGDHKALVAYYTAEGDVDENSLMESLTARMVYYMVPRIYCRLENMPKTLSGKIDRKALPKVEMNVSGEYTAPQNELQSILCEVFAEVLGVSRVGINDSFFDLGGDSIKGIQVTGQLYAKGLKLRMRQLFDTPTVKELEPYVTKIEVEGATGEEEGEGSITPIQRYFFHKDFEGKNDWNQSVTFDVKEDITEEKVKEILDAVVRAHDVMHAVFDGKSGRMTVKKSSEHKAYLFESCKESDYENARKRVSTGLDIKNGPLVGVVLCRRKKGASLFMAMHHLICDGVTWRIITEDLNSAYAGLKSGGKVDLPAGTSSYLDWTAAIDAYGKSGTVKNEIPYWRETYRKGSGTLPVAQKQGTRLESDLVSHDFELDEKTSKFLTGKANEPYGTRINDLLLTALAKALFLRFGIDEIAVSLEGHGREDIGADVDISRTAGWFTVMYPAVITGKGDLKELIKLNKEALRSIPGHGLGHDILRYSSEEHDIAFRDAEISFNYLGEFSNEKARDEAVFNIAEFGSPYDISPDSNVEEKIRVTGIMNDGRMRFSIACCEEEIDTAKAERLCREFKKQLENIADKCAETEERVFTPSDLGWDGLSQEAFDTILARTGLQPGEIEYVCPTSPVQQGMLSLARMFPEQSYYFEQTVISLKNVKLVNSLKERIKAVEEQFDVLRASIVSADKDQSYMVVRKNPVTLYTEQDLSALKGDARSEALRKLVDEDRARGFDYEKEPLFRTGVFKLSKNEYAVLFSYSHIILDKWSTDMLFARMLSSGTGEGQSTLSSGRFLDYVKWLKRQDLEAGREYFKSLFEGCASCATLPAKSGASDGEGFETYRFAIPEEYALNMERLAREHKVTVSCCLLYIWGRMLNEANNTKDAVFGYTMSGRTDTIPGIEHMAGNFINTLPVRIGCDTDSDIGTALKSIQEQVSMTEKYAYFPIGEIQKASRARHRLIEHFLTYQNTPDAVRENDASQELYSFNRSVQAFSVSAGRVPGEGIVLFMQYDKAAYTEADISNIADCLIKEAETI
ncbi:MAG: amino acid adenylation domain-containing protein [Lachnospiraceae bacterium]|nr:amino acid adenylation domain-containing protein [Lachnospiraceae bacterium]